MDAQAVIAQAHGHSERQTFLPMPGHAQTIFTIHVDTVPPARAIDSAAKAVCLHAALASMSEAVLHYRNLHTVRGVLLRWLAERAGW